MVFQVFNRPAVQYILNKIDMWPFSMCVWFCLPLAAHFINCTNFEDVIVPFWKLILFAIVVIIIYDLSMFPPVITKIPQSMIQGTKKYL